MIAVFEQNNIPLPAALSNLDRIWIDYGHTILRRSKSLLDCMGASRDATYDANMLMLRLCPLVADAMQAFLDYRVATEADISVPFSFGDYKGVEEYRHLIKILVGVATFETCLGVILKEDESPCKVSATECANCLTPESPLKQCSRCKLVQYCGRACQTQHWKASHKSRCVKVSDRAPSLFADLPKVEGDACRICLESLQSASATTALSCGHTFHASCVADQAACPLCRSRI
jgi:hypothetical protein